MKKIVIPAKEIEYDLVLEYPHNVACPYRVGDIIMSPIKDGIGTQTWFYGSGFIVYIEDDNIKKLVYIRTGV